MKLRSLFITLGLTLLTLALTLILSLPNRLTPGMAHFLSPFEGVWNRGLSENPYTALSHTEKYLGAPPARVQLDDDHIPHIIAGSDHDLYFLQGFIAASERLWQMELTTRAASGRLAEILGERALKTDIYFRTYDLRLGAERAAQAMISDPETGPAVQAYADGVNAFIEGLQPRDLPFEFKLLGFQPEAWSPYKTALIMKMMTYQLAAHSRDVPLTRALKKLGNADVFQTLFPIPDLPPHPSISDSEFLLPSQSETRPVVPPRPEIPSLEFLNLFDLGPQPDAANGSNNWAVGPSKSVTGASIIANDVHLDYALPSLWYVMHLASPSQNVMGATIPGAPSVIVGFNEQVSWATTNGGVDVLDWYQLKFLGPDQKSYIFDGESRPIKTLTEDIPVRGQKPYRLTRRFSHFGPVLDPLPTPFPFQNEISYGLSFKWLGHQATNEIKTFLAFNHAKNFSECQAAGRFFTTPLQVFLCTTQSDIGIFPSGKIVKRAFGEGRFVRDGSTSQNEWPGMIPESEMPYSINPKKGFIFSANQSFVDQSYPHFINFSYGEPFRSQRIYERLQEKELHSVDDFKDMQSDATSLIAREALPKLLKLVDELEMSPQQKKILTALATWDFKAKENSIPEAVFTQWWKDFESLTWEPLLGAKGKTEWPKPQMLIRVVKGAVSLKELIPSSQYDLKTAACESFKKSWTELSISLGDNSDNWTWKNLRPSEINHALGFKSLSRKFDYSGTGDAILANRGKHGPVWRMVVSMKPPVKAWGVYPGGQSGDPFSKSYDSWLEVWKAGDLKPLSFYNDADHPTTSLSLDHRLGRRPL